jgi:DNA-binding CsgD family transcriptional regulator
MEAEAGRSNHEAADAPVSESGDRPVPLPAVGAPELHDALHRCDFPLIIWGAARGVVELANQAAADLWEKPLRDFVGSRLIDLGSPRDAVERTIDDIASGSFKGLRSERELSLPDESAVDVQAWTRAIDLAGTPGAVTLIIPNSKVGTLGRDPTRPWRELVPIAVGLVDSDWRILGISTDVVQLIERTPSECLGRRLTELIHPDDLPRLEGTDGRPPHAALSRSNIRVERRDRTWVSICFLVSPAADRDRGQSWFGMVGPSGPLEEGDASNEPIRERVRELESRLRRIGSEVRGAGLLDNVAAVPPPQTFPEVGDLTARQWEILSLLLQGQRVSTIAQNLFVSQSTVRNHLATIFKKFGVHSQAELLETVRERHAEGPGSLGAGVNPATP